MKPLPLLKDLPRAVLAMLTCLHALLLRGPLAQR